MRGRKFAVFGVGKYGSAIAKTLANKGAEVLAFDSNLEKIERIKDDVSLALAMDCTDFKLLKSQHLEDIDAAIVAIGENFEATILTAAHLKELKIKRVIARSGGSHQRMILEKIGIEEILTPEDEVAFVVAERLLNPSIVSFLQLPDDYEVAEIKAPKSVADKTVDELGLRNKYSLTLITIKREFEVKQNDEVIKEQHIIGVPKSEQVIYETDTLVVFGTSKDVSRFIEINQ
jgi:trk system potassium uptake protein